MTLAQLATLMEIHREVHGGGDGRGHQSEQRISITDDNAAAVLASFASGRVS